MAAGRTTAKPVMVRARRRSRDQTAQVMPMAAMTAATSANVQAESAAAHSCVCRFQQANPRPR
jgi:hypothetical protein